MRTKPPHAPQRPFAPTTAAPSHRSGSPRRLERRAPGMLTEQATTTTEKMHGALTQQVHSDSKISWVKTHATLLEVSYIVHTGDTRKNNPRQTRQRKRGNHEPDERTSTPKCVHLYFSMRSDDSIKPRCPLCCYSNERLQAFCAHPSRQAVQ